MGETEEARRTLAELPPPEVALGDPAAALEIADLHLALGDAELARERLRTLTGAEPECRRTRGTRSAARRPSWATRPRCAPPGSGPGRWTRRPGAAGAEEQTADGRRGRPRSPRQALAELPERARELLRDVPIVIAEQPAEADVDAGVDPRSLGLFNGTAYPDGSHLGGQPGLTQILIFRRNLERVAASDDELREEIRTTLLHETGHFFGMNDEDLEGVGLG